MISKRALEDAAPTGKRQDDFAGAVGQALRLGWSGHFDLARASLLSVRDRPELHRGQRALCLALLALASAALDDPAAVRRLARQAIHHTARPSGSMKPKQLRDVQFGRALAANASALIGDHVRARRAAQVRYIVGDPQSEWLVRANAEVPWLDAPSPARSYARFTAAVHRKFNDARPPGTLTAAERGILHQLAVGESVRDVATALGRSEHTIRTHLRNSYRKLGVSRASQAVHRARILRLLDP